MFNSNKINHIDLYHFYNNFCLAKQRIFLDPHLCTTICVQFLKKICIYAMIYVLGCYVTIVTSIVSGQWNRDTTI